MKKLLCPFGLFFHGERLKSGFSQWSLALSIQYHVRNIQRIEKGEQHPGIMLALRLVTALEGDVGDFFMRLHQTNSDISNPINGGIPKNQAHHLSSPILVPTLELSGDARKKLCPFGPLFKQLRLTADISQTAIAKYVGYSLRNMNSVEQGKQEPRTMIAVALIAATGADVGVFFTQLHDVLQHIAHVEEDE